MKTTFGLNFDLYQTFKQHGYTQTCKQKEAFNKKSFPLITGRLKKRGIRVYRLVCYRILKLRPFSNSIYNFQFNKPNFRPLNLKITQTCMQSDLQD